MVNVGLKSGTNSIHGTAFAFGRDGDLFDAQKLLQHRAEYKAAENPGAIRRKRSAEPIIKNKAFFFGAYEGQML